jgi:deoxyribodipyrimidine photo-lyase
MTNAAQTAIVVFTRDLRLHDNPALHLACARAQKVVPLFARDPGIPAPPNRSRFLAESLADLRNQLRERHADLIIRRGDPSAEIIRLAAETDAQAVYLADDVSHYAARRRRALERECARHRLDLTLTPGLTVVPPDELKAYKVFTPYWRAWRQRHLAGYPDHHDDLPGGETSRLSAYLRFGCR